MKLSEILQRLEELKQENGDIELQHINDVIKTIPADWIVTFPPKKTRQVPCNNEGNWRLQKSPVCLDNGL